jgi:3-methyladenine DNA glycosylase AlkD
LLQERHSQSSVEVCDAFGIQVGALRRYAKSLGPNHDLAAALWETGWYSSIARPKRFRRSPSGREVATISRSAPLLASLTVHDKTRGDAPFFEALALVERAANDERNFVKKAVNWALRSIGKRSALLNDAAVKLGEAPRRIRHTGGSLGRQRRPPGAHELRR